jgi:hypothetical protein
MTNILVAVPAHSGITRECSLSLWHLRGWFDHSGIASNLIILEAADIARGRNDAASFALANKEFTHLLFIDADMQFNPASIEKMMKADKPVIGCVCPARNPSLRPNVYLKSNTVRTGSVYEVAAIGTGIFLIQRLVLDRLAAQPGMHVYSDRKNDVFCFFTQILTDKEYLSEDLAFCRRWTDCGGTVWALDGEDIGHVGTFTFRFPPGDRA